MDMIESQPGESCRRSSPDPCMYNVLWPGVSQDRSALLSPWHVYHVLCPHGIYCIAVSALRLRLWAVRGCGVHLETCAPHPVLCERQGSKLTTFYCKSCSAHRHRWWSISGDGGHCNSYSLESVSCQSKEDNGVVLICFWDSVCISLSWFDSGRWGWRWGATTTAMFRSMALNCERLWTKITNETCKTNCTWLPVSSQWDLKTMMARCRGFGSSGKHQTLQKGTKKGGTFLKLPFLIRGFDETRDARNKISKLTKWQTNKKKKQKTRRTRPLFQNWFRVHCFKLKEPEGLANIRWDGNCWPATFVSVCLSLVSRQGSLKDTVIFKMAPRWTVSTRSSESLWSNFAANISAPLW